MENPSDARNDDLLISQDGPTVDGVVSMADAIRAARGRLTQTEFASRVGCCQATISMIEAGKQFPTLDLLARIEDAFDLPRGRLAANTGYVEANASPLVGLLRIFFVGPETAVELMQAAELLGLGVRMHNRMVVDDEDADLLRGEWVVEIADEPAIRAR